MGFTYQMLQFQEERLWAAAQLRSMGLLLHRRHHRVHRASARLFGQPMLDNQYVHFRLAELKTEVEALRALTYRATRDCTSRART